MRIQVNGIYPPTGGIVKGNEFFQGNTPLQLIRKMHESSRYCPKRTLTGYIKMLARNMAMMLDVPIELSGDGLVSDSEELFEIMVRLEVIEIQQQGHVF